MPDRDTGSVYIGTYARSGGEGLYPLLATSGDYAVGGAFSGAPNASFGVYAPRFGLHYLVDEREEGMIRVFRRDGESWKPLARLPSHGALPCYLALDASECWLAVANYGSGDLALLPLDPESGLPGDPASAHRNKGHGPHPDRQEGPHAHCAVFSPDGAWLYQTDLGTDEILAFPFDPAHGLTGKPRSAYVAPPGSGPRHLVFHPHCPRAYLVSELASTLTVFETPDGTLAPRAILSTLPSDFRGESLGGHLGLNARGDRLYVSNRGHDSIAVFALDPSGQPSLVGHTPAGGASPRFFLLRESEARLIVANEEGNNVTIFAVGGEGTLSQVGEVGVPAPAFLFAS